MSCCYYIGLLSRRLYLSEWACENQTGEGFVLEMHSFFYVDWIHFQYSCKQSNVKWTHLQVVFQLDFVSTSRISVGFWFVERVRWLVSVWCRFLLWVFSNRRTLKLRIISFLALIIKLLSNIMSLALLSFKSIKHFDLQLY